nr:hypothetical protein [Tanacetum cinerariifolium]
MITSSHLSCTMITSQRFEFILPHLGMKSLSPTTLKRLQEEEGDDGNDKVVMWYQEPRFGLEFCLVDLKMIPEPGDANREITITETFHLQTEDELFDKELKQIKADDQAIQTILLGLPEDIYAAV